MLNFRPFPVCESSGVVRLIKYEPISVKMIFKYVDLLARLVEKKIAEMLPKRFALVFYKWSTIDKNFVA